jgi:hypothetical protein
MRFGAALVAIARYYLRLPEVQIQGADWPGAGSTALPIKRAVA